MKSRKWLIVIFIGYGLGLVKVQAQFRGSNLMEFQLGNLPQLEPKDQSSLYDQTDLSYKFKAFGAFARVEQFYPSFEPAENYTRLSQFRLQYNSGLLDVDVGNFYSSLGRGLLLRTYEIPSSIWETRGYRVRYGFYRDILGASVKINFKNFELKVLRGEVLDVTLPPTIDNREDRRPDLVEGSELSYRFKKHAIGFTFMREIPTKEGGIENSYYSSLYYDGTMNDFSIYGELARRLSDDHSLFTFSEGVSFGTYGGINYTLLSFGISLEYKNYHNFSIGTGINDPPTLVKEHSYRLLNRSTHVPVLTDESGYQLEMFYSFENGNLITVNSSLSKNEINADREPVFQEYFAEYQFHPKKNIVTRIFADYARDPFINENQRYAAGGTADFQHKTLTSSLDLEWQHIQRKTDSGDNFYNLYAAYTLTKASKYSASLVAELTKDPIQLQAGKTHTLYPALNLTYRPDNKNIISLFAGRRRGGPACNSGVCYDVLDFEGIELRISTRF